MPFERILPLNNPRRALTRSVINLKEVFRRKLPITMSVIRIWPMPFLCKCLRKPFALILEFLYLKFWRLCKILINIIL